MNPKPPSHLCPTGRAVWQQTVRYLASRGLLHDGDLATVEAYSIAFARMRALDAAIGTALVDATGKVHPALRSFNSTAATVTKLGAQLGLGPITRARLGKVEEAEDDSGDWGDLLKLPAKGVVTTPFKRVRR
jgi:P27 family predicted phage terminase small subunit